MAKSELGTKRACKSCGAKFYDLEKRPVECPKCEATFMPDVLLPSKETAVPDAKPAEAAASDEKDDAEDTGDVEVISLDDADAEVSDDADEDDEIAAIADVDLGDDDADDDTDEEDNTFLETDTEDEPDVTGLIGGVAGDEEDS